MNKQSSITIFLISIFSTSLYPFEEKPLKADNQQTHEGLFRFEENPLEDSKQTTPLHRAAANGQADQIKSLLDAGANIEAQDCIEGLPCIWLLQMDIQRQSNYLLQLMQILKLKIIINILRYIWAASEWTIQRQSENLFLLMLTLKLKILLINGLPYIWLQRDGYIETIRKLISAHANIEAQDNDQGLHYILLQKRTYRGN